MTAYRKATNRKILHKHCSLAKKCFSQWYGLATLKILYMYNKVEQIRTINMPQAMKAKFLTIKEVMNIQEGKAGINHVVLN